MWGDFDFDHRGFELHFLSWWVVSSTCWPSVCLFCERLQRIDIISPLNVWQNSPVKPFGPGALHFIKFLIDSVSLMHIGPFRWPTFLGWILVGIGPFRVSYSICGHRVVHKLLLLSLKPMGSLVMAPLSFLIVISCVSSFFFSHSPVRHLTIVLVFSKNQLRVWYF